MTPERALDIERVGTETLGDGRDLRGRHEQKHGVGIDEATDQPGTGNTIDFWAEACHPHRTSLVVMSWQIVCSQQRLARLPPGCKAAFQRLGVDAAMAKPTAVASLSF